ncbi:MAG: ArsR/SmtB family transcription factor [Aggregatilineales bacterium]
MRRVIYGKLGQEHILDMLKAVADESWLRLLRLLHEQEHTVGDLAEHINLTEPTVSHHLTKLREAALVTLRMAGNQRLYRINERGLANFKHLVAQYLRRERGGGKYWLAPADEEIAVS